MTEHRHEWQPHWDKIIYGESWWCECGEMLGTDEIERRLNATEALSSEDAKNCAWHCYHHSGTDKLGNTLEEYARILEGE